MWQSDWWRTAALVLVTLAILAARGWAGEDHRDRIHAFEKEMKSADASRRVQLIGSLASEGTKGAAPALLKFTVVSDQDVRRAALEALGELKDPTVFARIMRLTKIYDRDAEFLPLVVRALGSYGDIRALKTLKDLGRKWLPRDSRVAGATAEALGNIKHRSAVELLIGMLKQTSPSLPSNSDKDISMETRRMLRESRPAIVSALQALTGWDFQDAEAWERFWKLTRTTWKPADQLGDPMTGKAWVDPGYGFRIERPEQGWQFDRSPARRDYRIYLERKVDGLRAAYVYVWAARDQMGLSSGHRAEEALDRHRGRMKDIREDSVKLDDFRSGRERGTRLSFVGLDGYGSAARVEERFLEHDGIIFVIGSWCRTGLPADVGADIQEILDSFTVLD
jgi:HEAT repeat protein